LEHAYPELPGRLFGCPSARLPHANSLLLEGRIILPGRCPALLVLCHRWVPFLEPNPCPSNQGSLRRMLGTWTEKHALPCLGSDLGPTGAFLSSPRAFLGQSLVRPSAGAFTCLGQTLSWITSARRSG